MELVLTYKCPGWLQCLGTLTQVSGSSSPFWGFCFCFDKKVFTINFLMGWWMGKSRSYLEYWVRVSKNEICYSPPILLPLLHSVSLILSFLSFTLFINLFIQRLASTGQVPSEINWGVVFQNGISKIAPIFNIQYFKMAFPKYSICLFPLLSLSLIRVSVSLFSHRLAVTEEDGG